MHTNHETGVDFTIVAKCISIHLLFITGWSSLLLVSSHTDTTLTPDSIVPVMKEVRDWRWLAAMLLVPDPIVQRIAQGYTTERQRICATGEWWVNTYPSPSWDRLALALYCAGEYGPVEKVSQYLPKGTHMESVQTGIVLYMLVVS